MARNNRIIILLLFVVFDCFSTPSPLLLSTLEYPPYIVTEDNQVKGVAVELVSAVFKKMNQPIIIKVRPWARALHETKFGEADAIFTIFKTAEREEFIDYSEEILFMQKISLIHLSQTNVHRNLISTRSFHEHTLCAVNKVSYGNLIDTAIRNNSFKSVVRPNTAEQCVLMLLEKRVSLWVSNEFGAISIINDMKLGSQIKIHPVPVKATPSYIGFSKLKQHSKIKEQFDLHLKIMKNDGSYNKLINIYLNKISNRHFPPIE